MYPLEIRSSISLHTSCSCIVLLPNWVISIQCYIVSHFNLVSMACNRPRHGQTWRKHSMIFFSALKIIINRPHLFYGGLYMYWNETVVVSAGVVFDSLTIGNPFLMKFQNKITSNSNIVWIVVIIALLTSRPQRRFKHSFFKTQ